MSQELHYTSVPRGLKPGSRGFCTVGLTAHMPGPLVERLEALSGYQPVFPPHDPSAALNPIVFSHLRLTIGGKVMNVLSRIGPAGLDYSGRPNKYAHHMVLEGSERPEGGPAWLLSQTGFMQSEWDGEPREFPIGRVPPHGDRPPGLARAWQALTGDGGWAGVLAESFLADSRRTVFVVFRPGMDLLPLFVEALALLPASRRWEIDFSTYFSQLPQGVTCAWRGVLEGSEEAKNALRLPNALVLDLCSGLERADGGELAHLARTGERPEQRDLTLPESSRHPAQTQHHPSRPAGDTTRLSRRPRSRSPGESFDLLPELARLAPGARSPGMSGSSAGHSTRRSWMMVSGLAVACLVTIFVVSLFLRTSSLARLLGSNPEIREELAARRDNVTEIKKKAELEKVEKEPPAADSPSKTAVAIATGTKSKKSTTGEPTNTAPISSPNSSGIPATKPEIARQTSDLIENPLFFALEEPGTSLSAKKQKPLRLENAASLVVRMELLGLDKDFFCETSGSPPKVVVSVKARDTSKVGDKAAKVLGTFEASADDTVSFRWAPDQRAGYDQDHVRGRLRDCVLRLKSTSDEERYCILRAKPTEPEDIEAFLRRADTRHTKLDTISSYKWDADNIFMDTSRTVHLIRYRALDNNGQEVARPEKAGDGSWEFTFRGEVVLKVRLDRSEIVARLQDGSPQARKQKLGWMSTTIRQKQGELDQLNSRDYGGHNDGERTDSLRRRTGLLNREIKDLLDQKDRLLFISRLHDSFISTTLTYEVDGLKFVIARVERPAPARK